MIPIPDSELETLMYPRGRSRLIAQPSAEQLAEWIDEIDALPAQMRNALTGLSDAQLDTPYRPDGWTVRQVAHHVPDSHLNAYARTCLALTEDRPTIRPYDQRAWAELEFARTGPVEVSLAFLAAIHARWVPLLRSLTPAQLQREYYHPEDQKWFTIGDLIQTYAWHSRHHLAHITGLRERSKW
jgi:hypothetical protein